MAKNLLEIPHEISICRNFFGFRKPNTYRNNIIPGDINYILISQKISQATEFQLHDMKNIFNHAESQYNIILADV